MIAKPAGGGRGIPDQTSDRRRASVTHANVTTHGRAGVSKSPPPGPGLKRSSPPGNGSRPCPRLPDQRRSPSRRLTRTQGHVEPRPPGPPSYPNPKIKIHYAARRPFQGQRQVNVNHQG